MFSSAQKLILKICAIIIVLGLGILAIDRWIVNPDKPSQDERIQTLIGEFGLTPQTETGTLAAFEKKLGAFQDLTGKIQKIGPVFSKSMGVQQLWLFEYTTREVAIHQVARPDASVDVTLFGIYLDLGPGAPLPAWTQNDTDTPPTPPHTEKSVAQLQRLPQYRMAMQERHVLFVSTLETWSLKQAVDQQTSPEFHPGLFNSAMKVDVQMALDVINQMDTGNAPLPRFYTVDIGPLDLPAPDISPLQNKIQEATRQAREKMDADREALRLKMEKDRAENQARMDAARKAFKEKMDANNERLKNSGISTNAASATE